MREGLDRFFDYTAGLVRQNIYFVLWLVLFNFMALAWDFYKAYDFLSLICYAFSLALSAIILLIFLEFLKKPLRRMVKALLFAVCGSLFFVELFTLYSYDALLGAGILNSMVETNLREAGEFLYGHIALKELFYIVFLISALIFIIRRLAEYGKNITGKSVQAAVILGILGSAELLAFNMWSVERGYLPMQRLFRAASSTAGNIAAYRELSENVNAAAAVELTRNDGKIKNVVLIIGESCNRNHMGLYGYYLPTTPHLSALFEAGELYAFSDVVSPHSTTIAALSKLLTFCDWEADGEWYEYGNIVDILNAAGYKTVWLSNQESSGIWGSVAQLFASRSQSHAFTKIRDSREDYGILDEELLPLLDDSLKKRAEKNFFVLHLMGQHDLYYKRYPYSFNKFTEKDILLDVGEKARQTAAYYDNSVLYNDYIVTEIINRFRDTESLVIYISDHGEAVYDGTDYNGHIEENPSRHMIEIPCLVWASEEFKENYGEKWAQIAAARDKPYMSDDMIHTLLELMDIETPDWRPKKSIINNLFDNSRQRIYNGIDYDKEIKTGLIDNEAKKD